MKKSLSQIFLTHLYFVHKIATVVAYLHTQSHDIRNKLSMIETLERRRRRRRKKKKQNKIRRYIYKFPVGEEQNISV